MGYSEYLASPEWRELANRVKVRDGCCVICGSTRRLQVHHRTYERIGCEKLTDLTTVCDACHALYHAAAKVLAPRSSGYVEDFRWGADAEPATAEEVASTMAELREKLGWGE